MVVDYLIVGQGICGTHLSYQLLERGKSILVIDEARKDSSSKVAAGIINPVTGRHYLYSWMIDELMPFAQKTYEALETALDKDLITSKSVIDFFPTPDARNTFIKRMTKNDSCLHAFPDQNHFNQYFNYDFGCGEIKPAYLVQLKTLLQSWRNVLTQRSALREEAFQYEALKLTEEGVCYNDITAKAIIFCEGAAGMNNPFFDRLPFSPNKGEALIIRSEGLNPAHIFKKGMLLAPLAEPHHYWAGSNYLREFENAAPSEQFREQTTALLQRWIKKDFTVVDHQAAVRPATVERRPFVGMHPHFPQVGILNGMGTKGTSLSPFFAAQLVSHLVNGTAITPEADVKRFSRLLTPQS